MMVCVVGVGVGFGAESVEGFGVWWVGVDRSPQRYGHVSSELKTPTTYRRHRSIAVPISFFFYLRGRHVLARGGRHVRLQHGVPFQADVDVVEPCQMMMVQCGWVLVGKRRRPTGALPSQYYNDLTATHRHPHIHTRTHVRTFIEEVPHPARRHERDA